MICRICGNTFKLRPNKPGLANVCEDPDCAKQGDKIRHDYGKWMAGVSWENKHTPVITIMKPSRARAFNNAQKRWGAGVTKSITQVRYPSNFGKDNDE